MRSSEERHIRHIGHFMLFPKVQKCVIHCHMPCNVPTIIMVHFIWFNNYRAEEKIMPYLIQYNIFFIKLSTQDISG
jgi:hypothetical protein